MNTLNHSILASKIEALLIEELTHEAGLNAEHVSYIVRHTDLETLFISKNVSKLHKVIKKLSAGLV